MRKKYGQPPTVTLLADGQSGLSVWPDAAFTLSWRNEGADDCQADALWGGDDGVRPLQGQETMPGFASGSRTYTITCANRFGSNSSSVTVSVKPRPSLSFYHQPTFPRAGQAFTLYWNSGGAASCTASGAWGGGKPMNGRQWMPGFRSGSRTYTLTCSNPAGSVTRSVTVRVQGNVAPPPRPRPPSPRPPQPPAPVPFSRQGATLGKVGTDLAGQTNTVAITRITYRLAGQPVAVRVGGDPDPANNGLHYLYADHLGGINAIQRQNGTLEQMRYYPFGAYRSGGRSPITDRAFTGQRENMELGLYYYNARYYLPGLGRFLSADTIVPDPQNPQSLNRYAYVLNRPLNFSDPTGHNPNSPMIDGLCGYASGCLPSMPPAPAVLVTFTGGWTANAKQVVYQGVNALANRMAESVNWLGQLKYDVEGIGYTAVSAKDAFLSVFNGPITLNKAAGVCTVARDCVAWVNPGETIVNIGSNFTNLTPQLVIHEIFHIFDLTILDGAANQAVADIQNAGVGFPDRPDLGGDSRDRWGFAGGNFSNWQKSRSGLSGEEFADMGIGWTYNQWDPSDTGKGWSPQGQSRANFMNVNIALWVSQLLP